MANYLVTGGAGFIGSHIVEALLKRGDRVRVLDNFATSKKGDFLKQFPPLRVRGGPPRLARSSGEAGEEGLRTVHNPPSPSLTFPPKADPPRAERGGDQLELFEANITDPSAIAPAFRGIDGVFHTAALARVQLSIDKPRETDEVNITGTLNVLLAARDAGVKRVVYSASSSAYGDQPTLPLHEEMKPNPKSPYGLQKYVGEEYCKVASEVWGLETVSLRYFNVYGPRLSFEGAYVTVIAVFLKQRAEGVPLTITGDGTQTRDFIYIDDVVRANLLAMESKKVGQGEVMNIGAGNNQSVNEVAALFKRPSTHIAPRLEPHDTLADISRAKKLLGWKPQVPFEEGLRRTMDWFNSMKHRA